MYLGGISQHFHSFRGGSDVVVRTVSGVSVQTLPGLHLSLHDLLHLPPGVALVDGVEAVEALEALIGGVVRGAGVRVKVLSVIVPHSGWRLRGGFLSVCRAHSRGGVGSGELTGALVVLRI